MPSNDTTCRRSRRPLGAPEIVAEAERLVQARRLADDRVAPDGGRVPGHRPRVLHAHRRSRRPGRVVEVADQLAASRHRTRSPTPGGTAEALLAGGPGRSHGARRPILEATGVALELGAKPLLRQLRELAIRALIPLTRSRRSLRTGPCRSRRAVILRSSNCWRLPRRPRPWCAASRARRSAAPAPPTAGTPSGSAPGTGGPAADRPGTHKPGDRRAPVHHPQDRRRPRREHPRQARRVGPRGAAAVAIAWGSPSATDAARPGGGLRVSWVRWYPAGWAPPDATGGWQVVPERGDFP